MVTSATTIEYRNRYNQVSSGNSAITALQLIIFQVCPVASREGRLRTQKPLPCASKMSSARRRESSADDGHSVMVASRSVEMSGYDTDDESEEFSPSQYLEYRLEKCCDANNQTDNQMLGRIGLDIRILRQA
jgi:hypothetical protein